MKVLVFCVSIFKIFKKNRLICFSFFLVKISFSQQININLIDSNGLLISYKKHLTVIDNLTNKTILNRDFNTSEILIDSLVPAQYIFSFEFEDQYINTLIKIKNDTSFTILVPNISNVLSEVIIYNKKEDFEYIGTRYEFDAKNINLQTASFGDPSRVVQNLPGIQSADDNSNRIVVRGNSPTNTAFFLEDIEIPNSSALGGAMGGGGGISIFNENSIDKFSFYNSVYPSKYNNSNGALFNILLKKGDALKRKTHVKGSPLGGFLGFQGFIKKGKAYTYNFNARIWDISWLKSLTSDNDYFKNKQIPSFKDYTLKISIPFSERTTINFSSFGGKGSFLIQNSKNNNETSSYLPWVNIICVETKLTPKIVIKNRLAQTFSKTNNLNNSYFNTSSRNYVMLNTLNILEMKWYSDILLKINSKLFYSAGISFTKTKASTLYKSYFDGDFHDTIKNKLNFSVENYYRNIKSQNFQNIVFKPNIKNEIDLGVFISKYSQSTQLFFEPRFNYQYKFNSWLNSVFSIGKSSKLMFENTPYTKNKLLPTHSICINYAQNIRLKNNLNMKFEIYYQTLYKMYLTSYNSPYFYDYYDTKENMNTGTEYRTFLDNGLGRNYGFEYLISKKFTNKLFVQLAGSFFRSQYKVNNTSWLNTPFDSKFNVVVSGNKEFTKVKAKRKRTLLLSFRLVDFGGFYERPINLDSTIKYNDISYSNLLYNQKSRNYFRFDFGLQLKYEKKIFTHEMKIDLINITNRVNYLYSYYEKSTKSIQKINQLPFLPVITYGLYF